MTSARGISWNPNRTKSSVTERPSLWAARVRSDGEVGRLAVHIDDFLGSTKLEGLHRLLHSARSGELVKRRRNLTLAYVFWTMGRILDSNAVSVITEAASLIRGSRYLTAFTGAGISVESGIPPFRGEGGLWNKYDPRLLELDYFLRRPEVSWPILREIFYDRFGKARPNKAHEVLARLEKRGVGGTTRGLADGD